MVVIAHEQMEEKLSGITFHTRHMYDPMHFYLQRLQFAYCLLLW